MNELYNKSFGWILITGALWILSQSALSMCFTRTNSPVTSICSKRSMLPSDKVRNLKRHFLSCGTGVHKTHRVSQGFDFGHWSSLLEMGKQGRLDAYEYRKNQAAPKWSGQVNFETAEVWSWEECVYETNGAECGYRRVCRSRSDGSRSCHDQPKACWYDKTRWEALPCSHETMTYDLEYEKPDPDSWNPDSSGYYDAIPNKYDLLPGEYENILVFNQNKKGPTVTPSVKVNNNWNKYDVLLDGNAVGKACEENFDYHLDVRIVTRNRINKKRSPNAFQLPVYADGSAMEPIVWESGPGKDGKTVLKAFPSKIRLTDKSAGMMNVMAKQSRKTTKIRSQVSASENESDTSSDESYWKTTKVKVELFRENHWFWKNKWGKTLYTQDVIATKASDYAFSEDQEIIFSDFWEIDLDKEYRDDSIFRHDNLLARLLDSEKRRNLQPNRNYVLRVSMYNEGVPFYNQSCEIRGGWDCHPLVPVPLKRTERKYYSKPIEIKFRTSEDFDQRGLREKILDEINFLEKFLFWLGDRNRKKKPKNRYD